MLGSIDRPFAEPSIASLRPLALASAARLGHHSPALALGSFPSSENRPHYTTVGLIVGVHVVEHHQSNLAATKDKKGHETCVSLQHPMHCAHRHSAGRITHRMPAVQSTVSIPGGRHACGAIPMRWVHGVWRDHATRREKWPSRRARRRHGAALSTSD
jgi:hypothetical protein